MFGYKVVIWLCDGFAFHEMNKMYNIINEAFIDPVLQRR